MISSLKISNFKSIKSDQLELGSLNVLIGENGSGKSNILEAVAFLGSAVGSEISHERLISKGIRLTRPDLMTSSFRGAQSSLKERFSVSFQFREEAIPRIIEFKPQKENDIYTQWFALGKPEEDLLQLRLPLITALILRSSKQHGADLDKPWREVLDDKMPGFINQFGDPENYIDKFVFLANYLIYNLDSRALRGLSKESNVQPLGTFGEGLDVLLADFSKEEMDELLEFNYMVSWLDEIVLDKGDRLKLEGHKLGRSNSILYFRDRFMKKGKNLFSVENSNEGVLHVLFYLALMISKKTPKFFAIDNIETALNPKLCREVTKALASLAKKHGKQVLITTHNPAILDGLNLHDEEQRLFVVSRSDEGYTQTKRVKIKPQTEQGNLKLSEMWMRGLIGGVPRNF